MSRRAPQAVEIYQRISRTTRVSRDLGGALRTSVGMEEGTALRHRSTGATGCFVSGAGADRQAVAQLLLMLRFDGDAVAPRGRTGVERLDIESAGEASSEELECWLATLPPGAAWIESAVTVENWVGPVSGRVGQRVRRRTWAMVRLHDGHTCWVAGRGERLPDPGLLLEAAVAPRSAAALEGVWLAPVAAAQLVPALVLATHRDRGRLGSAAGPGWSVSDDPTDPEALFGGAFDDELNPTRSRRLAGDGRIVATLPERGMQRRASFRDPPATFPANLVLDGPSIASPGNFLRAASLTLHPLDADRWVLELNTPEMRFATTSPEALIRGCLGTCGPPVRTHRGVTTAGLLFDGSAFGFE